MYDISQLRKFMITQTNSVKRFNIVGRYKVETNNNVSFTVILKENSDGFREFEIILSKDGSDDYNEIYDHPFYNNFVLPWSYKQETPKIPKTMNLESNIISFNDFRNRKNASCNGNAN